MGNPMSNTPCSDGGGSQARGGLSENMKIGRDNDSDRLIQRVRRGVATAIDLLVPEVLALEVGVLVSEHNRVGVSHVHQRSQERAGRFGRVRIRGRDEEAVLVDIEGTVKTSTYYVTTSHCVCRRPHGSRLRRNISRHR